MPRAVSCAFKRRTPGSLLRRSFIPCQGEFDFVILSCVVIQYWQKRVETSLSLIPGVYSVSASAATGSVVVLFDQQTELAKLLPAALERVVCHRHENANLLAGPPTMRWVASGTCLVLATAATFVAPVLVPVTALALVGFNLSTMRRGIVELCTFRWGIAALYTVIMGTTLLSGQILAAALMQASITCWHGWASYRLRKVIIQLRNYADMAFIPCHGRLDGGMDEEPALKSRVGSVLTIKPGTILPCDGLVVDGEGDFDERCVRGIDGIAHKAAGEQVFAGCILLRGQLRVHATAIGKNTRHSKVHQTVLASIEELSGAAGPTERSQSTGARFVPFTFAAGTAALAVGDISTLAAVLRPDFTTGPSISEQFGTISQIGHLLRRGWLVKNAETLSRLARAELVVVMRVVPPLEGLAQGSKPGNTSTSDAAQFKFSRLTLFSRTVDIHEIEADELSCIEYVRQLRASHQRIAILGSGRVLQQLADDDMVRVSLTPEDSIDERTADVVALHAEPQHVEDLLRVLHESSRLSEHAWAAVIACNALAISGAFLVGLTSLHVVVLTNLGALAAGAIYNRSFQRAGTMISSQVPQVRPYALDEVSTDSGAQSDNPCAVTPSEIVDSESQTDARILKSAEPRIWGQNVVDSGRRQKNNDNRFDGLDFASAVLPATRVVST